ncbi:MAG: site-specific integrase [Solirubrobacteraceae bacterium]
MPASSSAHTLRHTAVTNLIRSGADVVLLAEIAGHRRLDTTRRYSLPSAADRDAALKPHPPNSPYRRILFQCSSRAYSRSSPATAVEIAARGSDAASRAVFSGFAAVISAAQELMSRPLRALTASGASTSRRLTP